MRESFIAQYLEEQKRLGAELKVYEQSPKSSKKKNTGSHYEPVK